MNSAYPVLALDEATFSSSEQDEAVLLEAISEADRGDLLDPDDVLKDIP